MRTRLLPVLVLSALLLMSLIVSVSVQRSVAHAHEAPEDAAPVPALMPANGLASTTYYTNFLPLIRKSPPCSVAPRLISPTNGSQLTTLVPTLTFLRGTDPVSRTMIEIADNLAFGTPIRYWVSGGSFGPDSLRLWENLVPATTYYWRVQDICGPVASPFATVYAFATGSGGVIPPAPTLIDPPDNTVGVGESVTLTWSAISNAVGYQLLLLRGEGGGNIYFPTDPLQRVWLSTDSTYLWNVLAYNDYAYGDLSSQWSFTTASFSRLLGVVGDALPEGLPEVTTYRSTWGDGDTVVVMQAPDN